MIYIDLVRLEPERVTVDTNAYRDFCHFRYTNFKSAAKRQIHELTFQDKSLNPYVILFTLAERIKF